MADDEEIPAAKKAAVIILSLEQNDAVKVLKELSPSCMELIAAEIRNLDEIDEELLNLSLIEFTGKLASKNYHGGDEVAFGLLESAFGKDEAAKLISDAADRERVVEPFKFLKSLDPLDIASLLSDEKAATIAIVLGFLNPEKVGEILILLDAEIRDKVVMRLSRQTQAKAEVIESVEDVFTKKLSGKSTGIKKESSSKNYGGPQLIADIIQKIDDESGNEFLEIIGDDSEELKDEIAQLLFTFDDIIKLSDMDIQRVLRDVPMDKLPLALKGVSEGLLNKFANNLSKRAKENLFEEMELMGKVKLAEVKVAQKEIVNIIRSIEASGDLTLRASSEDEEEYV